MSPAGGSTGPRLSCPLRWLESPSQLFTAFTTLGRNPQESSVFQLSHTCEVYIPGLRSQATSFLDGCCSSEEAAKQHLACLVLGICVAEPLKPLTTSTMFDFFMGPLESSKGGQYTWVGPFLCTWLFISYPGNDTFSVENLHRAQIHLWFFPPLKNAFHMPLS